MRNPKQFETPILFWIVIPTFLVVSLKNISTISRYYQEDDPEPSLQTYLPLIFSAPRVIQVDMGFEVSQGIQRPDNGVPLVSNRETIVRVTLTSDVPYTNVYARLYAYKNNLELPDSPIMAINNPRTLQEAANRTDINSTFNFRLPKSWLDGSVSFKVIASNGTTYSAISKQQTFVFTPVPPLKVTIVPIYYYCNSGGSGYSVPQPPYDYIVNDFTRKVYPIPEVILNVRSTPLIYYGLCQDGFPIPSKSDWHSMLDGVTAVWRGDGSPASYYYGLVDVNAYYSGIAGMGWLGGYRAAVGWNGWGRNHEGASQTHAHEVAHNHNIRHSPGCGANDPDPNFPYIGTYGPLIGDQNYPNFGLDVFDELKVFPYMESLYTWQNYYDLMGYCFPRWISDYVYLKLRQYAIRHNNTGEPNFFTNRSDQLHFLVSGHIYSNGNTTLNPLFLLEAQPDISTETSIFDDARDIANLDLLDERGNLLSTYPIALRAWSDSPASEEILSFQVLIPAQENVSKIRLRRSEELLIEQQSKSNRLFPQTIIQDLERTISDHGYVLSWKVADNTELHYMVRISRNQGKTWEILAFTEATELWYKHPSLFGNNAWIEIQASDGMRVVTQRFMPSPDREGFIVVK